MTTKNGVRRTNNIFTVVLGIALSITFTGSSFAKGRITFKAMVDKTLCQSMIVDESKVMAADGNYGRDAISNARNADMPLGGEVVTMLNLNTTLEITAKVISSAQNIGAFDVSVSNFDFLNNGDEQHLYHVSDATHYFDGDIFIVTGTDVPESQAEAVIGALSTPSGNLDAVHEIAAIHGWYAFSGSQTRYRSTRYTTMAIFEYKGRTYLAATGIRPGPIAIVMQPQSNGLLKEACLFYYHKH